MSTVVEAILKEGQTLIVNAQTKDVNLASLDTIRVDFKNPGGTILEKTGSIVDTTKIQATIPPAQTIDGKWKAEAYGKTSDGVTIKIGETAEFEIIPRFS